MPQWLGEIKAYVAGCEMEVTVRGLEGAGTPTSREMLYLKRLLAHVDKCHLFVHSAQYSHPKAVEREAKAILNGQEPPEVK